MKCVFCLDGNVDDVRRLPCGHICCFLCITSLTERSEDVECLTCRKISKVVNAGLLETVRPEAEMKDKLVNKTCDHCEEQAEKFCVFCQLLLCRNHIQEDQQMARTARQPLHHYVPVEDFLSDKEIYLKHHCKKHMGVETSKACAKCLKVFCDACNSNQACKDGMHKIKDIAKVSKSAQIRLEELLKSLSEKMAKLSRFGKDLIAGIKQINDEAVKLQEEVDRAVNKQIKYITEEGERVKAKIMQFVHEYSMHHELESQQVQSADEQAVSYMSKLIELKNMVCPGRILETFSVIKKGLDRLLMENLQPVNVPTVHLVKQAAHSISIGLDFQVIQSGNNQEAIDDLPIGQLTNDSENHKPEFTVTFDSLTVKVYSGDITSVSCAAIVNAANGNLVHKGGVAGAIMAASDPCFQTESLVFVKNFGQPLCDGQVFTQRSTGRLPDSGIEFVINTVVPEYRNYLDDGARYKNYLAETIFASLIEAEGMNCRSIAIPALSSGIIDGVLLDICASAYWNAVMRFLVEERHSLKEIHFVNTDGKKIIEVIKEFKEFSRNQQSQGIDLNSRQSIAIGSSDGAGQPGSRFRTSKRFKEPYADAYKNASHTETKPKQENKGPSLWVPAETCKICWVEKSCFKFTELPCGHRFCNQCLTKLESITKCNLCPACRTPFKVASGPQPKGGTMITETSAVCLPGYESCGTIIVTYAIPDGIQSMEHPHPGQRFAGTTQTTYVPDNLDGQHVCRMLRRAFMAGLIFTVGRCLYSGIDNVVVWNGAPHKTSIHGCYGYPDPGYLASVEADLRAWGITDP